MPFFHTVNVMMPENPLAIMGENFSSVQYQLVKDLEDIKRSMVKVLKFGSS